MSTQTQENKYTKQLAKSHYGTWSASELLHLMRPEVEEILQSVGLLQPPSQTSRALEFVEIYDLHYNQPKTMEERKNFSRQLRVIQDFLAVHRTVWILEGKPI